MLLEEIDHALRPPVHEHRIASGGTIIEPASDPSAWAPGTQLVITSKPARSPTSGRGAALCRRAFELALAPRRRQNEWVVFDRPAGSERDLVVMASVFDATIVQRHPAGTVRVVGPSGVLRWEGISWHHEPPLTSWLNAITADSGAGDPAVLKAMLAFAVHDLGSLG